MSRPSIRPTRLVASSVALVFVIAGMLPAAAATPLTPHLRLVAGSPTATLYRSGSGRVQLDLGVYLASLGGPFRVDAWRPTYRDPIQTAQVISMSDGSTMSVPLAPGLNDGWLGLRGFLRITVKDDAGDLLGTRVMGFCPNSYDEQRINDTGPLNPTFPSFCSSNPFTRGMVWGIDQGWAVNTGGWYSPVLHLPEGTFHATVRVRAPFVRAFDIAPADATLRMDVNVVSGRRTCGVMCPKARTNATGTNPMPSVPTTTSPDPSTLPDLRTLPAYGISVRSRHGHDWISFGADVWNDGPGQLLVEGYRQPSDTVMQAEQYFLDPSGTVVGKAPVGTLEFDSRPGHEHWHFEQFASYQLLDSTKTQVERSRKTGFCIAPTDAIDLRSPGAQWRPELTGLSSSCGNVSSLWIRETLPGGWGDTYFQSLPGQAFDVTNLPNGTYYIAVVANPLGALYERHPHNDVSYRKIILGGLPGHRTVVVPPYQGIDTESGG